MGSLNSKPVPGAEGHWPSHGWGVGPPAASPWQVQTRNGGSKWEAAQAAHALASRVYAQELTAKKKNQAAQRLQAAARRWLCRRRHVQEQMAAKSLVRAIVSRVAEKTESTTVPYGPEYPGQDEWIEIYRQKAEKEKELIDQSIQAGASRALSRLKKCSCMVGSCDKPVKMLPVKQKSSCNCCGEELCGYAVTCMRKKKPHYLGVPCGGEILWRTMDQELEDNVFTHFMLSCGLKRTDKT